MLWLGVIIITQRLWEQHQACVAGQQYPTDSKALLFLQHHFYSIVTITSKTVAGEWWGQQVLDIADLHDKELEFEVLVYHLKLRELQRAVSKLHLP